MISVTTNLENSFLQLAKLEHKPVNQIIEQALTEFLEDYHDARVAEKAIENIHRGNGKLLTLDEFNQEFADNVDD